MEAILHLSDKKVRVNLKNPIDISIPLKGNFENPRAWYRDKPLIEPIVMGDWVGKVGRGASVNFNNISFSPHAHGTHTESYGHISEECFSVNKALKTFFFLSAVITVTPENKGGDQVITKSIINKIWADTQAEAMIIRTLPNDESKKTRLWSDSNWPYLEEEAAKFLREKGVNHLLIDLPSVDRERDDGKLLAHKAFWNFPEAPRKDATITEMIFVPNNVVDGKYLLNLQIASFENDASPSKPVLYKIL